jgi:hypothetical protein
MASVRPPLLFSMETTTASVEARPEPKIEEAAEAGPDIETFCFFPTTWEAPIPFLFLDSTAAVAFLAVAFFLFYSMVVRTSEEPHVPRGGSQAPPKPC